MRDEIERERLQLLRERDERERAERQRAELAMHAGVAASGR